MKPAIEKIVKSKDWSHYLTRPNSIFDASTWHLWYSSEQAQKIWKQTFPDAFFVEETSFNIRAYRPKNQITKLLKFIEQNSFNPIRLKNTLEKAVYYNRQAKRYLAKKVRPRNLESAIEFYIRLAVYGVVMISRIGVINDAEENIDPLLMRRAKKLRAVSYYTPFLEKIIKPMVKGKLGVDKDLIDYVTLSEFHAGEIEQARVRKKLHKKGQRYLYWLHKKGEQVLFSKKPDEVIKKLEPGLFRSQIMGLAAYNGKVRGTVRLVLTQSLSEVKFNKGEILVAPSTNPVLLPIMKKAAAIVTDEGGIMSHAAIVARELRTPCVIGTKSATRALKDGDVVEVDAERGVVKKLYTR